MNKLEKLLLDARQIQDRLTRLHTLKNKLANLYSCTLLVDTVPIESDVHSLTQEAKDALVASVMIPIAAATAELTALESRIGD